MSSFEGPVSHGSAQECSQAQQKALLPLVCQFIHSMPIADSLTLIDPCQHKLTKTTPRLLAQFNSHSLLVWSHERGHYTVNIQVFFAIYKHISGKDATALPVQLLCVSMSNCLLSADKPMRNGDALTIVNSHASPLNSVRSAVEARSCG